MLRFLKKIWLLASLSLCCETVDAVTLDWDTAAWTNGTLSNSYDVDPTVVGNDVTVTISGSTTLLQASSVAPNPATPAITTALEGGLSPVQKSLELAVNLTNQIGFITVTVDFSALYAQGVQNVSFSIFDIDFNNDKANNSQFQDQLRSITATSIDGVTQVAPTITTSSANVLTGTGFTQVVNGIALSNDVGVGSGNGNVSISFGTNAIRSFTFTYGSGSGTVADPTYQHVSLHDISFTPVPEINPAWLGGFSCLAAGFLIRRHNARL